MNEQNLKKFSEYPPDKLREISRKGALASNAARAERKRLREELSAILSSADVQQRVCTALIKRCEKGDARAFAILRDTLGENVAQQIELTGGRSLKSFAEEHRDELRRLYVDEMSRGEQRLYGRLAFDLVPLEMAQQFIKETIPEDYYNQS